MSRYKKKITVGTVKPEKKATPGKQKRSRDFETEEESKKKKIKVSIDEPQIKIPLQTSLNRHLVLEQKEITSRPKKLWVLPRSPNLKELFDDYLSNNDKQNDQRVNSQEMVTCLGTYFERTLPVILLYKEEREQYEQIRAQYPERTISEIYGADHLLRLIVRLPAILAQTTLEKEQIQKLKSQISDLLKFIQKKSDIYLVPNFTTVTKTGSTRQTKSEKKQK